MGNGVNNALMIGAALNFMATGVVNAVENKRQAEKIAKLEAKLAIPKDASTVEIVIAHYLIDNEGEDKDMEYKILVTQFTKLAVTCEKMFPDTNIAAALLDDIVALSKRPGKNYALHEQIEERKKIMTYLILDMRKFISKNKENKKEIKDELANFQYKMEYNPFEDKISKTIWELTHYKKTVDVPFYVKGTKVKIDIFGLDRKFDKYSTEEEAKEMASKLNEIFQKVKKYERMMGSRKINRGMLVDLVINPEKVETYKLELKGTKLGEVFGV